MKISKVKIHLFFLLFAPILLNAQVRGTCGTSIEDQQVIVERITEYQKMMAHDDASIRNMEDIYIPVKFHSVGKNDGSGKVVISAILDQLDKLNKDYGDYGMQFYFSGEFSEINNTGIFSDPPTNENSMSNQKVNNAMNIFITDIAVPPEPGVPGNVLGYYSIPNDLIVIRKGELVNGTNSLSHEAGHFFNLAHTFLGWEVHPYDELRDGNPLNSQNSPGYNAVPSYNGPQAENQDMSNCMQAADRVCDTPPDYNFGFGAQVCNYPDDQTRDFKSDFVMPQENNQMSYFLLCDSHVFTPDQLDIMLIDYNSPRHAYLRTGYVPAFIESLDMAVLTLPGFGEQLDHSTGIFLSWDPVTNAERYLVEVIQGTEYQYFITEETTVVVDDLNPNADVIWKVRPYTEAYTGTPATIGLFKTGSGISAVDEIEAFENLSIYPNPSNGSEFLNITLSSSEKLTAQIQLLDISGKTLLTERLDIISGDNAISLELAGVSQGIYLLNMTTAEGAINRKIVIQ